mmetsp:Transcript_19527/g.25179  ORF Transcript_19527/g.25179 Transcript_19527/m.25179 type:complete len:137 (+) Transcript_19527:174-584(+)|eukprot:CAMPEP_0198137808 /NCGR_PEP_ID=MMETSP1443-20131203/1272_1 /TAXON_ID=186043 /ORGANISM="Entomoneis sp., Strain CCMP2396" /LENGTH=136 /DNA_ID=CAMNT_0043799363 /DNA_START=116 /DNA_END=526 /DNA_ORIENTATION=-
MSGIVSESNNTSTQRVGIGSSRAAMASAAPSETRTLTVPSAIPQENEESEVLRLTLRNSPAVRWDESVVNNEGLGRKSSKRCCIFHKQRAFNESSTDSSDQEEGGDDDDENGSNNSRRRPIARPKNQVPDYQRFHA